MLLGRRAADHAVKQLVGLRLSGPQIEADSLTQLPGLAMDAPEALS